MKSLPENVAAYQRTPQFDETDVPETWLSPHKTKARVWGKIVVLEGRLLYIINEPREEVCLDPDNFGVVEPGVLHRVKLLGPVRFYIEFYR